MPPIRSATTRARAAAALAVCAALTLAGCGGSRGNTGEGDKINFCVAYFLFDRLEEPRPDDRDEALGYTEAFLRIIDRVDRRRPLDAREELEEETDGPVLVTDRQLRDLAVMERSLTRLRDELRAADTPAEVRSALNDFAEDETFRAADARTTEYYRQTCDVES